MRVDQLAQAGDGRGGQDQAFRVLLAVAFQLAQDLADAGLCLVEPGAFLGKVGCGGRVTGGEIGKLVDAGGEREGGLVDFDGPDLLLQIRDIGPVAAGALLKLRFLADEPGHVIGPAGGRLA